MPENLSDVRKEELALCAGAGLLGHMELAQAPFLAGGSGVASESELSERTEESFLLEDASCDQSGGYAEPALTTRQVGDPALKASPRPVPAEELQSWTADGGMTQPASPPGQPVQQPQAGAASPVHLGEPEAQDEPVGSYGSDSDQPTVGPSTPVRDPDAGSPLAILVNDQDAAPIRPNLSVLHACMHCRAAKTACSDCRPCKRCVRLGLDCAAYRDEPRKRACQGCHTAKVACRVSINETCARCKRLGMTCVPRDATSARSSVRKRKRTPQDYSLNFELLGAAQAAALELSPRPQPAVDTVAVSLLHLAQAAEADMSRPWLGDLHAAAAPPTSAI